MRSGTCWHRVRRHTWGYLGLLLLVALRTAPCAANECPNEPPLLGAHYMSNWHTGRWSQWTRCHDGKDVRDVYPERMPLTGSLHDVGGTYVKDKNFVFRPPKCTHAPCTRYGPRPCCAGVGECVEHRQGEWHCPGGGDGIDAKYFQPDYSNTSIGVATVRAEIIAAATHGLSFFNVECFGGVNGNAHNTEPVVSPNSDPYDTALELFLQNEETMRAYNFRFSIDIMNHDQPVANGDYTNKPELWDKAVSNVVKAVKSPSYLRICNRPWIVVGNAVDLVKQAGGPSQAAALVDKLRQAVRDAGEAEPLIGHGWLQAGQQYSSRSAMNGELGAVYDFTNSYGAFWSSGTTS